MKKYIFALLLCAGFALPVLGQSNPPLRLQEIDGAPNVLGVSTIKVTNGTLSCSGKVCTITISGGGGSPGGSSGQFQFNNAGAFGGTTGVSYASSGSPTVSITGQSTSQLSTLITGPNTSSTALLGIQLGTGGSSGDFVQFRNSSGTALSVIDSTGAAGFGITSSLGAKLHAVAGSSGNAGRFDGAALSTNTVLVSRQGASSIGNLFETQSSGGTVQVAILNGGAITQTSASATAFESGPNGSTNPVFRLVNNVASQATGVQITGNAAGSAVILETISSAASESLIIRPKSTGILRLGDSAAAASRVAIFGNATANVTRLNNHNGNSVADWYSIPGGKTVLDWNLASAETIWNLKASNAQSLEFGTGVSGTTPALAVSYLKFDTSNVRTVFGDQVISFPTTVTAGGTTGNQTINKVSGTVNFAASATSITVTNSKVSANSICFAVARTDDATGYVKNVVPGAGSFVINLVAAATAETSVGFFCINP